MKTNLARIAMCLAAVLATIGAANAAVEVNDKTEISLTVFVPCAASGVGEVVDLSGPLHTLISFTVNGNNVSGQIPFPAAGNQRDGRDYRGHVPGNWRYTGEL